MPPTPTGTATFTFAQIIEADHFTIERLAAKIRLPQTPSSQRRDLLEECIWRLIRHDFSEEQVMRPAFVQYLGEDGRQMAEHDRQDHARAKDALLPLLQLDLENDKEKAMKVVTEVFDELSKHMEVESGEMIPHFEKIISKEDGMRLAREYARTLVVTPHVTCFDGQIWANCFDNSISQYVNSSLEDLKKVFDALQKDAEGSSIYFDDVLDHELARMKVGSWTSFVDREAHRKQKETKGKL